MGGHWYFKYGNRRAQACPVIESRVTGKGFSQIARFLALGRAGNGHGQCPDASLSRNQSSFFHGFALEKLYLIIFSSIFRKCTSILLQIPHFNWVLILDFIQFGFYCRLFFKYITRKWQYAVIKNSISNQHFGTFVKLKKGYGQMKKKPCQKGSLFKGQKRL